MKQTIDNAEAFEGPAYHFTGDDGYPAAIVMPVILAHFQDKMWQLPNGVRTTEDDDGFARVLPRISLFKAKEIAKKFVENGFINPEHWVQVSKQDIEDYLRA
jgi:hypothetical protein